MLVEVLPEPAVKGSEFPFRDLGRDAGTGVEGGGIKLRAENIAYGVALKSAADAACIPMHVLQTAITIVVGRYAEIGPHAGTPSFRKILHPKSAFEQFQFEVETHHNVEVIRDLVGIRADQGALHLVDRPVKGLETCPAELIRKTILQNREKMLPKRAATADNIFPKPRLAFVHAD